MTNLVMVTFPYYHLTRLMSVFNFVCKFSCIWAEKCPFGYGDVSVKCLYKPAYKLRDTDRILDILRDF